jgi:hypothetical protein
MNGVRGVGGPTAAYRTASSAAGQAVFRLPTAAESSAAASASPILGALPLLAVQEAGDALERDRRAWRQAETALEDLSALQLALLEDADPGDILARLDGLRLEAAADPALAEIVAEVRLRARIEAARRSIRRPPSQS